MIHLRSVTFQKNNQDIFPYHLPFFDKTITFDAPVTLLIGENGTGKSTLIELINEILGLYKITHHGEQNKEMQEVFKKASSFVKCSYQLKKPKGFFFSAEDFTSYIQFLVQEKNQAYQELKRVEKEYQHKSSLSKSLASMPFNRTLGEINQLYERDLLKSSHGEAYLDFFKSRIRQNEIYLLDEPETPLSIQNQLALLSIIDEGVKQNNQFIIATHSPVIMAIPYANIYVINHENIVQVNYEDIESVKLLKQFMNHPDSFFRHLYDK
ncbi:MAG: AAA family ATPase [Acholeplasmataceae bacterium]|jgi:predicted ATPase|nr:AAA family ATPase [Acholeplasmataceae bacterium]